MQKDVTGTVRLKLYKGNCIGGRSEVPKNPSTMGPFATFEKDTVYNQKDAEGFIRLNALRLRIRRMMRGVNQSSDESLERYQRIINEVGRTRDYG
jgi:argininosuccinate synthase